MAADGINSKPDEIKIFLEYMENEIKYSPSSPFSHSMDRVLKPIRDVKPVAYTPQLVSIGPLHHREPHLIPMEAHKLRLVKKLIEPISNEELALCFEEMRIMEKCVRQCYSEVIPLGKDEFVRMMVVDGCFLLYLIQEWKFDGDPIFNDTRMPHILRDLILLENQLPFTVLEPLYKLRNKGDSKADHAIRKGVGSFLQKFLPPLPDNPGQETVHLLDYVRDMFIANTLQDHQRLPSDNSLEGRARDAAWPPRRLLFISMKWLLQKLGSIILIDLWEVPIVKSATELKKAAAVKFRKSNTGCFTDITFNREEGMLRIPAIQNINDNLTEPLLRNIIAYEQLQSELRMKKVTSYVVFMNDLINSPKDVKLLQQEDPDIFGSSGSNSNCHNSAINININPEEVAVFFKNLLKEVTLPEDEHLFTDVYKELDTYYHNSWYKPRTIWYRLVSKFDQYMGILKTKYFDSPWSVIGFLAAAVVLFFTAAQTFFSYESWKKGNLSIIVMKSSAMNK